MLITKFEEKVNEFALEQGWIPMKSNEEDHDSSYDFFSIELRSFYKLKVIDFRTNCSNVGFNFAIKKDNFDDLFDAAFKAVKTMGTLINKTRENKEENKEN